MNFRLERKNSMFGVGLGVIFVLAVFVYSIVIFTGSGWFNSDGKHAKIRDSAEKLLIEILLEHKYQTIGAIEKKWEAELDGFALKLKKRAYF